ncbi:uncharacterized protein BX664DRAFT_328214 [Halteromyces radiatus]|uniref:uncharacterized protein n=1 Tax=Halteromyces radiatus TaxID=101107 RepID=UPI00221FA370|nr:uncharacterized protein BX664DRAFT_328214 [Halteromyces radiatus]KAI8092813.1 hypothetical protein BX664DRAFT_328214 [Halteromyces radiatus]
MMMKSTVYYRVLIMMMMMLISVQGSTFFLSPNQRTVWQTGTKVNIEIISDGVGSGDLQLVDQHGFFPKDMGRIGVAVPLVVVNNRTTGPTSSNMYSFHVWDKLPEGTRYQLAFLPDTSLTDDDTKVSNAFSHYFTIRHP